MGLKARIYLDVSPGSVPVECMFSAAGYMLNSRRSAMAPYKPDMVLFIHNNMMWCADLPLAVELSDGNGPNSNQLF